MRSPGRTEGQGLLLFPEPTAPPIVSAATPPAEPSDRADRTQALDTARSWIVQAPAGSGKTELLTQRFLALLATVEEPEEILAITFTRAATAEMRDRILSALEAAAARRGKATQPGDPALVTLACAALARSDQRGWQLLAQPHRLDVQTIDSLCMRLAHGQPLLARLGGRLEPTEQAGLLYMLAAERTLGRMGRAPAPLETALRHLLLLRDNNLRSCRSLLARLLARRDQWRHIFPLGEQDAMDWQLVRADLEAPFAAAASRVLGELHATLSAQPVLVEEMLTLARYASRNGGGDGLALLDSLPALPPPHPDFLNHWNALRTFLLTQKDGWRIAVNNKQGFPSDGSAAPQAEQRHMRERMSYLIADLCRDEAAGARLRSLLREAANLPAPRYHDAQWQTLLSVFQVLRHAVAELHVLFAERDQVDFAELSIAAATLLDQQDNPRGLLASEARRHLLIDEFQDTSRRQHQLVGRLLREWQPGDGRTCFLVGDPMQSIYLFREAEVELFGRVQRRGLDCGTHAHPCAELTLSENFRSHQGLVEPLNAIFAAIFQSDEPPSEVPFSPSTAASPALPGDSVQVHAFAASSRDKQALQAARADELARVVSLVREELPRIESARSAGERGYTVAILARVKAHLFPVAAALRESGIGFRAVELEALGERQEVLDLVSLLRAMVHSADRIAWLSVLRAPWCGLTLRDLHALTGGDDRIYRHRLVRELAAERNQLLTPDGRQRLGRVLSVLNRAMMERFRHGLSLSAWLERTWTSLGGPAYLAAAERENVDAFFDLLDTLSPDGTDTLNGTLEEALRTLCATPNAAVSERFGVQLMTIHKAKGLGFEVVIVPSLDRGAGRLETDLVAVLERSIPPSPAPFSQAPEQWSAGRFAEPGKVDPQPALDEVLVAPLGRQGEPDRVYQWVQAQRRRREAGERKRVLYVACTRARRTLHLLGVAQRSTAGKLHPGRAESLLACAWPALGPYFHSQLEQPVFAADPAPTHAEPHLVSTLAASVAPVETPRVWRLPSDFRAHLPGENVTVSGTYHEDALDPDRPKFERPEGSFEQRARGTAIHAMLEHVARLRADADGHLQLGLSVTQSLERTARSHLRRAGLIPARVEALVAELLPIVLSAAEHPEGRWLLSPHPDAKSEWSLTMRAGATQSPTTLRVDRSFRAGAQPLAPGDDTLWIVDYKTGAEPGGLDRETYVRSQREQWRPQLEAYGAALRLIAGANASIRYALYFPELLVLTYWE